MGQIHITISDRVLERTIFILIILVLAFFAFDGTFDTTQTAVKASPETNTSDTNTTAKANKTGTGTNKTADQQQSADNDETDSTQQSDQKEKEKETTDQTQQDSKKDSTSLSGKVTASFGPVSWDMSGNSPRIINVDVTVSNGLQNAVTMYANITMEQSGNQDLDRVNPLWEKVNIGRVESGGETTVALEPGLSYPPGVKQGDTVSLDATFYSEDGNVRITKSKTVSVG